MSSPPRARSRGRGSERQCQQYAPSSKGPHMSAHHRVALIEWRELALHRRVPPIARVVGSLAARQVRRAFVESECQGTIVIGPVIVHTRGDVALDDLRPRMIEPIA